MTPDYGEDEVQTLVTAEALEAYRARAGRRELAAVAR
jgi:hypothetical protein